MELVIIQKKRFVIRGQRVMIDRHLAELYGVPTKSLNLAVKRNIKKFPSDFMFQLNREEYESLRFQIETLKRDEHSKYLPFAFTEHGITMLSSVLCSPTAIDVNNAVVRAFIFLKQYSNDFKLLQKQMHEMESRFNRKFDNINEIIEYLISKPEPKEEKPKPKKTNWVQNRREEIKKIFSLRFQFETLKLEVLIWHLKFFADNLQATLNS